jgi:phosphoribosyl 1,2-cyclic phosphate phosphodiesterase
MSDSTNPHQVELLFLGTGTSAGVPMIGCHCEVCSSTDPHDKRTRPSAIISQAGTTVLIDATPELRLQCVANNIDMIDALVLTHAHADHIMGLDDVRRFNALRKGPLDVWAEPQTHQTISRCFGYAFEEPSPESKLCRPHLIRREITGEFQIGPMTWKPIRLFHGKMPVLGFRVGRLAYCTDVNRIPDESFALLEDLDVLVLDALQHKRHTTHFSIEQAMEVVARLKPKQTRFTHIAHALGHEATNATLPENVRLAYDGERITAGIS